MKVLFLDKFRRKTPEEKAVIEYTRNQKLIEELTKVGPDELSTDGLKLFNKINEIIDKNKELLMIKLRLPGK